MKEIYTYQELELYLDEVKIQEDLDTFEILNYKEYHYFTYVKTVKNENIEFRVYSKENNLFSYYLDNNYYYYLDGNIVNYPNPLDSSLYYFLELSKDQITFFIKYPGVTVSEILNTTLYIDSVDLNEYRNIKKQELSQECQNYILSEYSIIKQINITNLNGYSEENKLDMTLFISEQRNKYLLLETLINNLQSTREIQSLTWDITYDDLLNYLLTLNLPNSLDIAKLKKIKEVKNWDKNKIFSGYYDSILDITLATNDGDVTSFTKDLTGLNSLMQRNETLPSNWVFLDKNSNMVTTVTPNDYVLLLNRYFVHLRNLKMQYANYMTLIYTATSLQILETIVIE